MRTSLAKLIQTGSYTEALSHFSKLHHQSHPLNEFTFPFLLKACAKLKAVTYGEMLHAHLTKTGFNSDIYAATSLTDMYMKFQFLDNALKVFDEIAEPTTSLINAVVSGFAQNGCYEESVRIFRQVGEYGLRPDAVTIAGLLSGCDNAVKDGLQIHCWAVKIGVESNIYVATSLVTMYCNCGDHVLASKVFERIQDRTVTCYNAFVTGLLQNRILQRVLDVFNEIRRLCDESTNNVTFLLVLSACSNLKNLKFAWQVHGLLVKFALVSDLKVGTALLDVYSKCMYWHWAYDVFKELKGIRSLTTWNCMISGMMLSGESENAVGLFVMLESDGFKPDSATWNTMIHGFSQLGKNDEAFLFFRKMQSMGESPSIKSINSLLPACSAMSALGSGKEIHGHVIRTNIDHDEFIAASLIDMYMKCGRSSSALEVFNRFEIKPNDPVVWNAMISGYGRNGDFEAAFDIFEHMQNENIQPNSASFNCILSVCSHTGQVEKGFDVFRSMTNYNLVPTSEHYACMIDILGRSGRIDEARELLPEILQLSPSALASVLGASKFHSDSKHGEEMAKILAEIEPENAMPFVILSNIYAEQGRWKDAEEAREEINQKRLRKIRGYSSVRA